MAVSGVHNGSTFEHAACHTNDAWLDVVAGMHTRSNSLGGWHDAGDYNKYVVNAGVTVGCMFRAWEEFGPAISKVPLHLPETGGALPEFLAELKWELDWLLTMQFEDGSVSHKVSTKKFGGFILPEKEVEDRFFTPWSSAATADFVAMMAQAARCFRPYDTAYADRCLRLARKSYGFLAAHGEDHPANLAGFSTGAYGTRDGDDRLWAAAEMWETTGEADALRDLETRIGTNEARLDRNWDWGNVNNLGMLTYLFSKRNGRNEDLLKKARTNAVAVADELVTARNAHGYGRPLGTMYYWGCNGTVARQVLNLVAANRITPKPAYRETALDALNHLFGRNCFGRSFVTGVGANPPMHPHDRRSGGDNVVEPWPGYLVGGPNPKAENWNDVQGDYRTNEIAINWNGALIYALAAFLGGGA
jgi:endoglucanase